MDYPPLENSPSALSASQPLWAPLVLMASLRSPGSLALTPTDGGFRLYTKAQRRPHPAGTAHEAARVLARGDGRPGRRPTVGPGAQQRFQQHAQEQGPAQGDPERRPWQFARLRGEGRFQVPAGHTVPTAPPAATRPASPRSRTPLSGRGLRECRCGDQPAHGARISFQSTTFSGTVRTGRCWWCARWTATDPSKNSHIRAPPPVARVPTTMSAAFTARAR
jgi:hypothetical protein